MDYVRKTYVELMHSVFENTIFEVESRDVAKIDISKEISGFFGFKFFDILEANAYVAGEYIVLKSARIYDSSTYYYGGHTYTREEVCEIPHTRMLLELMDATHCDKVIKTRIGSFNLFKNTDVLLDATG